LVRGGGDAGLGCAGSKVDVSGHFWPKRDAIFPALFVSVTGMIVVSLLTPKPALEQLAQFSD